jgi:hypothetical protein
MPLNPNDLDFAIRFSAVALKIRKARDAGSGIELDDDEVVTLIEAMKALAQRAAE